MALYLRAAAAVLIVLVLGQAISQKDISLVLSMLAAVMVGLMMLHYLEPVLKFLRELQQLGDLQGNMLEMLLKILGIGILTEITQMVCRDSGNTSLGQAMQLLGTAVILWLSLPIFDALLDIIQKILGEI